MSRNRIGWMCAGLALLALIIAGGRRLIAETAASGGAPSLVSFQGYVTDSSGDPLADGDYPMEFAIYDSSSGGSLIWAESRSNVTTSNGYFSVLLGNGTCTTGCPLGAEDFAGTDRYLQTRVDTGSGFVDFPRQQVSAVPYALQAEMASQAPWSGLTGVPAGFVDGDDADTLAGLSCATDQVAKWSGSAWACADDGGGSYANVIVVAKNGGDYASVAAALASITNAAADNQYLVQVMPGEYVEANLAEVKAYVHLQGAGPDTTIVTSTRSNSTLSTASATVDLMDNGRISDITIRNEGTGTYGIAIYSANASRNAVVHNVTAVADGSGGTGHYAAYLNDAEPRIENSLLRASGATGFGTAVNAAVGSVNNTGGFPQALILNSTLIGGANNNKENCTDPTGTGYGLQMVSSSPFIRDSYICGGHRGIYIGVNGHAIVQNSFVSVSSSGSAYLFEITASGSISVGNSGITYLGNKFTGAGTGLRCVHNYHYGTWQPASDGTTAATACN